jgi:hypothetical protein
MSNSGSDHDDLTIENRAAVVVDERLEKIGAEAFRVKRALAQSVSCFK